MLGLRDGALEDIFKGNNAPDVLGNRGEFIS